MTLRRLSHLRAVVLVMVICMSLVSCSGSKISQENFEKIQTGMSLAQVTAILGPAHGILQCGCGRVFRHRVQVESRRRHHHHSVRQRQGSGQAALQG